jgi:lipopolysaccharide biosynthesis protein
MSKREQESPSPRLVVVLGMHRSGTSLIAHLLQRAGFYAGEEQDLIHGNRWNRDGYFERFSVIQLNDIILELAGGNWQTPPDEDKVRRISIDAKIADLMRVYDGHSRSLLKDPRLCLTLPVWRNTLGKNVRILCVTRSAGAVAASLKRRDGIPEERGKALWQEYNRRAEAYAKEYPAFTIPYEDLFSVDRERLLGDMARFLGIEDDLNALGSEIIDPALDHANASGKESGTGEDGTLQVFSPAADGYTEAESFRGRVRAGTWQRFFCALEPRAQSGALPIRIDPFDAQAIIEIAGITLRSAADGSILWRARTPESFQTVQVSGTSQALSDPRVLKIFSYGDDPQIYLPQGEGDAFAARMKLEFWLRVDTNKISIARLLSGLSKQNQAQAAAFESEKQELIRKNSEQAAAFTAETRALAQQNAQQAADAQQTAAQQEREMKELRAAADQQEKRAADAQLSLGQKERELQEVRTRLQQKEKQVSWLQTVSVDWGKWVRSERAVRAAQVDQVGKALVAQVDRMQRLASATSRLLQSMLGEEAAQKALPLDRILEGIPSPDAIRWMTDSGAQEKHAAFETCERLFDSAFYEEKYPDVKASGIKSLQHYIFFGSAEGRMPNPLFDPNYYLTRYPDVAESGMIALHHYAEFGRREGRLPHPQFEKLPGVDQSAEAGGPPQDWKFLDKAVLSAGGGEDLAEYFGERINKVYVSSPDYVPRSAERYPAEEQDAKVIAFYFPQFHPFPENEEFWGKGFTEWTSATKALPLFAGHEQPRLPSDLGFYDTRLLDVMREQIAIAKQYGIYGFCFHHYWFGGRRVMRVPYNHMLANPDLDIPFCLHWANEPWTVRWDGFARSGVLLDQKHNPEDDLAFIEDIAPALADRRYIRIHGRPLLVVYRPGLFPDMRATIDRWKTYCAKRGLGEPYLAVMQTGFEGPVDPRKYGFDAAIEYPPHNMSMTDIKNKVKPFDPKFSGHVFEYSELVKNNLRRKKPDYTLFRGAVPDWDCTPRRKNPDILVGSTPGKYRRWLHGQIEYTRQNLPVEEQFLFINAWNEWAEGAYLEPDRKNGFAYLQSTALALKKTKIKKIAMVAHLYFDELADEFLRYFENMPLAFDLYISTTPAARDRLSDLFTKRFGEDRVQVRAVENRGRDMAPFFVEFADVYPRYDLVCKVQGKKRSYNPALSDWRSYLMDNVLGSTETIDAILGYFENDPHLGLVFPEYYPPIAHMVEWGSNWENVSALCRRLNIPVERAQKLDYPAGSMFWFRPQALEPLFKKLGLQVSDFEKPAGEEDGSLSHAMERMIGIVPAKQGYTWKKVLLAPRTKDQKAKPSKAVVDLNLAEKDPPKTAVVAHLYYPDLADELLLHLKSIPIPFDLYLSTTKDARGPLADIFSAALGADRVQVHAVENAGLDIGPFVMEFGERYAQYDLVCKIHGKKSLYNPGHADWRPYLMRNLLGSPEVVKTILTYFRNDPALGMVFPDTYPGVKAYNLEDPWRANWDNCVRLGARLGLTLDRNARLDFPEGSMFWFRPDALTPLFSLGFTWADFGTGPSKLDGTLAHAMERLFALVAQKQKYSFRRVLFDQPA